MSKIWNGQDSAMEVAERLRSEPTLDELDAASEQMDRSAREMILTAEGLKDLDFGYEWTAYSYTDAARMFRCIESAIVELSKLPEDKTRSLTGLVQAVLSMRLRCLDFARKEQDADPSFWCLACRSKTRAGCDCPPIADNE